MPNKGIDEMDEKFKLWDPMKDDYFDSRFNLYDSGPGGVLDTELQPAELAKQKNCLSSTSNEKERKKRSPFLVFRNLPKNMTAKGIKQLCERYGNVKEVDNVAKSQTVFVKFNDIADMESVHRALVENEYGLKISIGKHFIEQQKNEEQSDTENSARRSVILDSSTFSSNIDMEKRTIRPSGKNLPRPKFAEKKQEIDLQNSALPKKDPLLYVLKENDAHSLERSGVSVPKIAQNFDDEYEYRTGRAHLNMPEKTREFLVEKHRKSNGTYDAEKEIYYSKNKNENENLPIVHKCVVCKVPADISCYRCSPKLYIYCGRKCQNEDWENHRKICGGNVKNENILTPPKSRETNKSLSGSPVTPDSFTQSKCEKRVTEKSPSFSSDSSLNGSVTNKTYPKPDMPASNSVVAMTAVSNTNVVFIRSKSLEDNTKFFETISMIQKAGKKLRPLKKLPIVGKGIIAKFKNSNQYGRAVVLNVTDEQNIKINFLDYGNIETQELSNLFSAPGEFLSLPRFAVPVLLKDVPNYYMTNEIRSFMYSYLRDIDLLVKYDEENDLIPITNLYQVDLYDASTNQHLNQTIITLCKPQEPNSVDEIITVQDLDIEPLPVGKNIKYYVMDNSQLNIGCISCTTKEFALEIEKFSEDIQRYANSLKQQSYAPRSDEMCIAKYSVDGQWYRGRCLEKVGDGKPTILFIDYGNIAFVKVTDIRPYPRKFTWPIYTGDFGIEGLPEEVSDKLIQRLEELIPFGHPLNCDLVEKIEGNFYNITQYDLIKKLKEEKLLD